MVFSLLFGNQIWDTELEERILVWTLSTQTESRKLSKLEVLLNHSVTFITDIKK